MGFEKKYKMQASVISVVEVHRIGEISEILPGEDSKVISVITPLIDMVQFRCARFAARKCIGQGCAHICMSVLNIHCTTAAQVTSEGRRGACYFVSAGQERR